MPPLLQRLWLPGRILLLALIHIGIFSVSLALAYLLRFDFQVEEKWQALFYQNIAWIVPLKIVLFFAFGQFEGLPSYFRLPDLFRIFFILLVNNLFLVSVWYLTEGHDCPPRSVILGDFVLSLVLVCGFRTALRVSREGFRHVRGRRGRPVRRVGIVGAGDAGAAIAADMLARRHLGLKPVAFFDDNKAKWRHDIHGIMIVGSPDAMGSLSRVLDLDEVVIAMPSASGRRIGQITRRAQEADLPVKTIPSLAELATGEVQASRVRPVAIEDLLGREPVRIDSLAIQDLIADRVILVTGAGGSIGSELCRQSLGYGARQVLLLERSEIQLFQIEQELIEAGYGKRIQALAADILDHRRMRALMAQFRPSLIFHAAAHKHVSLMERQPAEAIKNNTLGTQSLADLAGEWGVERFVLISTDKAINPTSVMGASKRLAEVYIQAKSFQQPDLTRFMAVRFGNVLGSSGSVVPLFKQQIEHGGPVTLTHPEVTRYFMTIPEAVGLVLQSAAQGQGGEIFVLDMGESIKISDLAHQMIELSGLRPEIDVEIHIIGLRPGEKLYEEIQHCGETLTPTEHPRVLRFVSEPQPWEAVTQFLHELRIEIDACEREALKRRIQGFLSEYQPYLEGSQESGRRPTRQVVGV